MNEALTLFDFVARVARLREAQRRCLGFHDIRVRRVAKGLGGEVDALIGRALVEASEGSALRLSDEFKDVLRKVFEMRQVQRGHFVFDNGYKVLTAADLYWVTWLETVVDEAVEKYTAEAKQLTEQIRAHNEGATLRDQHLKNSRLLQPCNGQKVGSYGKNGGRVGRAGGNTEKTFENA